ncbi:DNA mismatch repair protein MutL, partial [filamentous cyanobacterium CCP4]
MVPIPAVDSPHTGPSRPIQPLPGDVVHSIAAGEVIDSLAAAVRELIENALDARATHITVALWPEQGRVQVADNGIGMALENLHRAAIPHSTSKIRTQADLWQVQSLGFRGEALHSLAQVAQLEICSRPSSDESGWRVTYSAQGEPLTTAPVAMAPGSIVTLTNLFAQWPARRQ